METRLNRFVSAQNCSLSCSKLAYGNEALYTRESSGCCILYLPCFLN